MSGENTVTTLNGLFKEVYADKLENLIPEGTKFMQKVPFYGRKRQLGNLYHQPVILGLEHGITYAGPTDDAFAKLDLDANNITGAFSKAELTDILLYHALSGEVNSDKALTLLGDVTMANGQLAGLKAFDGSLFVNDDSKVIIPDVNADNGVIHVVDTVILGPWPVTAE